jgi:hypothetical protein
VASEEATIEFLQKQQKGKGKKEPKGKRPWEDRLNPATPPSLEEDGA